jgi:hypothetical protein
VILTLVIGAAAGIAELAAMTGLLSDPGPGGDTPAFEHAKNLAGLAFFIIPVAAVGIASLIHLPYLRTRTAVRRALGEAGTQDGA